MKSGTNSWFLDIINYFRFVIARRVDAGNSVFPSVFTAISCLLILAVLVYSVYLWVDPLVFAWNRKPPGLLHQIFGYITLAGQVEWVLIVSGVILVFLSLSDSRRFTGQRFLQWHRSFLYSYFTFTAVAFSGLLGILIKNAIGRARPIFTPEVQVWFSVPFGDNYIYASFPSGHAITGGAIAMVLALLILRWRWMFILAGLAIAGSRPILGVHFPSDVVAGFAFGAAFVWLYARLFAQKRLLFKYGRNGQLALRNTAIGKPRTSGEKNKQPTGSSSTSKL